VNAQWQEIIDEPRGGGRAGGARCRSPFDIQQQEEQRRALSSPPPQYLAALRGEARISKSRNSTQLPVLIANSSVIMLVERRISKSREGIRRQDSP